MSHHVCAHINVLHYRLNVNVGRIWALTQIGGKNEKVAQFERKE